MLTNEDSKYWRPLPQVLAHVTSLISDGEKVLEIGPGNVPFARATHFVDHLPGNNIIVCDIEKERLPFEDKSFDFIYCRHVVEDIPYPFNFLREMSRVGKAGYIETPSVLAEMCRGIDQNSPPWRGYHHHQWFVWNHDGILKFIKKFPVIEYFKINEDPIDDTLRRSPAHWNTYLHWKGSIQFEEIRIICASTLYQDAILQGAVEGFNSSSQYSERWTSAAPVQ